MNNQNNNDRKSLDTDNEGFQSNLRQIFFTVWNQRMLALLCIIGVLAPIVYYNYTTDPTYSASTSIIFQETSQPIKTFDVTEALFSKRSFITNKIEEIKSRTLAENVIAELPDSIRALYSGSYLYVVKEIRGAISASPVRDADVINISVTSTSPSAAMVIANTITKVLKESSMEVKRTEISRVRQYIEDQLKVVKQKLELAEENLKDYKEKEKVTVLDQESYEILRRVTEAEVLYNRALSEAGSIGEQLRYIEGEISAQRSDVISSVTQITSPYINRLKSGLVELELQLTDLELKNYDKSHPKVQELNKKIQETKDNLTAEVLKIAEGENLIDPVSQIRTYLGKQISLRAELVTYQTKAQDLKKIIDNYNSELSDLPEKELNVARLERDKAVNDKMYMMLLQKKEEARIIEEGRSGNIRVIDVAILPRIPIAPRKAMNIIIGLIVGVVLGVGMAVFLESMDVSLKSIDDIENKTGLPVLAAIPVMAAEGSRYGRYSRYGKSGYGYGRSSSKSSKKSPLTGEVTTKEALKIAERLVTHTSPKSAISETYRSLRTSLQFADVDKPVKSVIITSANPGEGKSTTVANLAIATAQMNLKTLLVDSDLRKPVLHSLFGYDKNPGLIDVINNGTLTDEFLHKTDIDNLWLLTCGSVPPNPSEMLGSQAMRELQQQFLSQFDYIFYDTPPIVAVTDAVVLSTIVDSLALVVKFGETTAQSTLHTVNILRQVNTKVSGTILNSVDIQSRYGSRDYYYYYHHYYSKYGGKYGRYGSYGYGYGEKESEEEGEREKKVKAGEDG